MELAAVHINKISNPKRTFPLAIVVSVSIIFLTLMAGSLAIALILPADKIGLTTGIMQIFAAAEVLNCER